MKVILSMAITANGLIAGENDEVHWVSKKSWDNYLMFVRKIGCCIIGRRTYEIMPPTEFQKNCIYVVFTNSTGLAKKCPGVRFVSGSPKDVLKSLEKEGIKEICLLGGGKINSGFMKGNLVDEIYLDVEPVILGKGIRLFADEDFEAKLKLLDVKKFSKNEIQLHYKILK